jgi:hypothetical protein
MEENLEKLQVLKLRRKGIRERLVRRLLEECDDDKGVYSF